MKYLSINNRHNASYGFILCIENFQPTQISRDQDVKTIHLNPWKFLIFQSRSHLPNVCSSWLFPVWQNNNCFHRILMILKAVSHFVDVKSTHWFENNWRNFLLLFTFISNGDSTWTIVCMEMRYICWKDTIYFNL